MGENATTAAAPAVSPLLLDAAGVGRLLSISRTSVFGLLSAGRLPAPVFRAGRIVRWDVGELQSWIAAGCPARDRWESMKRGVRP